MSAAPQRSHRQQAQAAAVAMTCLTMRHLCSITTVHSHASAPCGPSYPACSNHSTHDSSCWATQDLLCSTGTASLRCTSAPPTTLSQAHFIYC